ncbi:L-iditol 2-dehydrogenase [Jannaschia sp. Os4]|uniref:L-iditol 2-dehydrogenase n=1 Tax=Jannaschia sp. Os4 TaxID=2807617 RepID=UPI00193A15B1|nr:L-iditol 2-dehydrogenase [Jannaschia sp. Os4]
MNRDGQSVLITGAARGIGLAFARAFAAAGATVWLGDLEAPERQAAEIGGHALAMDVTDQSSIDAAVAAARPDVLVNNAALFHASPTVEIDRATYDRLVAVNVTGALFTLQSAARSMIERGSRGYVVNMASQAGRRGEPLVAVYCATKAAIISLTQSTGLDLIRHGINVNAIAPGVVDGEHWDGVDALFARHEGKPVGQKKREVGAAVPAGRMGTADDLVPMALFLASPAADYVVGQTYGVDGGNWLA